MKRTRELGEGLIVAAALLTIVGIVAAGVAVSLDSSTVAFASPAGASGLVVWGLAHCDTLDGPVVALARKALETGNVKLVLPWVRPEDDATIRAAFERARAVRGLGADAREVADTHFFETLVRVHRASEGEPFTGLKPAGLDLGPAVPAADRALAAGEVDEVVALVQQAVERGIRERFERAKAARAFDPNDVGAGRLYVAAYVPYVHYVERLYADASGAAGGHGLSGDDEAHAGHGHAGHHAPAHRAH